MAKTRIKLNLAGFNELRKRAEVESIVTAEAEKISAIAGEGFASSTHQYGSRVVARVYPITAKGMAREAKHGLLSKAVGGGG